MYLTLPTLISIKNKLYLNLCACNTTEGTPQELMSLIGPTGSKHDLTINVIRTKYTILFIIDLIILNYVVEKY